MWPSLTFRKGRGSRLNAEGPGLMVRKERVSKRGNVMTERTVAEDKWGQIIFYDDWNSLELKWLPSTASADDDGVKSTMELFAKEAVDRRPTTLIVDTTEFRH